MTLLAPSFRAALAAAAFVLAGCDQAGRYQFATTAERGHRLAVRHQDGARGQVHFRHGAHRLQRAAAIIVCATLALPCAAATRSHSAKAAFQRIYHCPATDKPRGPCPGYIIDHVKPLCAGGADDPLNIQWQTIADAKAKDRIEVRECAALRHP